MREGGAFVVFLIGVAAEVVFLFEEEPVFAAEEVGGGEAGDATADDGDVNFFGGGGAGELVAVADLVADFEVFAFGAGSGRMVCCSGEEARVDGAAGGDGTGDDVLDEIAA